MPFMLKFHKDSTTGLIAVCDVCGCQVDGYSGNVCWRPGKEVPGETRSPFFIVCKGVCDRVIEKQFGHQYWQDLDTAIGYLINNTRTDLKRVRHNMALLARIG